MKAIVITALICFAAMFCSYCFTHQFNISTYITQSGAMVLDSPHGDL